MTGMLIDANENKFHYVKFDSFAKVSSLFKGRFKVLPLGGDDILLIGKDSTQKVNKIGTDIGRNVLSRGELIHGHAILTSMNEFKTFQQRSSSPKQLELNLSNIYKYTKEEIREKLEISLKWLERGILAIYQRQTQEEKLQKDSIINNGVGFSGADAQYLSSLAEYLKRGGHLSGSHISKAKKRMQKYAGQLSKIANKEIC